MLSIKSTKSSARATIESKCHIFESMLRARLPILNQYFSLAPRKTFFDSIDPKRTFSPPWWLLYLMQIKVVAKAIP
jgi:hypothetical protein